MSDTPENPVPSTPAPTPSPYTPVPGQSPLKLPTAPAAGGLRPPVSPAPVAPAASAPLTAPAPAPLVAPKPVVFTAPPVAVAPIATAAPAPVPVRPAPVAAKLPERPAFVSPMPVIEDDSDSIPSFLPIVAGFAAAVSIAFAVLIFLKQ